MLSLSVLQHISNSQPAYDKIRCHVRSTVPLSQNKFQFNLLKNGFEKHLPLLHN